MDKITRVMSKTISSGDCIEWIGWKTIKGYGIIRTGIKNEKVHRISYEHFIKKIPKGLVIDHLCRNRACVNPKHLEAVTNKENVMRGIGIGVKNLQKTHCLKGHSLIKENIENRKDGKRSCKVCKREKYHALRQEAIERSEKRLFAITTSVGGDKEGE